MTMRARSAGMRGCQAPCAPGRVRNPETVIANNNLRRPRPARTAESPKILPDHQGNARWRPTRIHAGEKNILLIRDTPPVGMYVLNMFRMRGSRLWGSRLHRACVV